LELIIFIGKFRIFPLLLIYGLALDLKKELCYLKTLRVQSDSLVLSYFQHLKLKDVY